MILSLNKSLLAEYVRSQIDNFFPDGIQSNEVGYHMDEVLDRVRYCFSAIHDKYFKKKSQTCFNHLNTDQYAIFLYYLSNTLYKNDINPVLCEKIFYLNKVLHGLDVFYTVELPDIFVVNHPMGTVLGGAKYSNYFFIYQNCTIGSNHEVDYPVIGEYVAVYKGASILGKCNIGNNCKISADSLIIDRDLEDNSIYIGTPINHVIKKNHHHDKIWNPKETDLQSS